MKREQVHARVGPVHDHRGNYLLRDRLADNCLKIGPGVGCRAGPFQDMKHQGARTRPVGWVDCAQEGSICVESKERCRTKPFKSR
jgi:hypothetical protein